MSRRSPLLLELDLTRPLLEVEPDDPIGKLRARNQTRLRRVIDTLHEAGSDPRVAGLIAKLGATQLPLASAQELRDAVHAFAAGGKPTVAWSETFGESSNGSVPYLLATGFTEIWLQPSGELGLLGVAAEPTFLRGALDKAGVEPLLDQRHEYKNAADRIMRSGFTDAHREAADRLVASAWDDIVAAVAAGRGLGRDVVEAAADRAPLSAAEALRAGLVDRLGYRDEVYADVRRRIGTAVTLRFADRWSPTTPIPRRIVTAVRRRGARHVAVVEAHGTIVTGRSRRHPLQGPMVGSDTVAAAFRAAREDDTVAAVVFRVDSPGGSYVGSDTIWREVSLTRDAGIPVVVSMGALAGSGGYFVACPADVIVAQPATLTGSIGVFGGKVDVTGLLAKVGLRTDAVSRGEHARMFSPRRGFSDSEQRRLTAWLDEVYDDFVAKVATGRAMAHDAVHDIAKGRVWSGADAQRIGLVDALGGMRQAGSIAREHGGLPDDAPLRPAVHVPPLARLRPATSSADPRAVAASLGEGVSAYSDAWGSLASLAASAGLSAAGPLQMR